MFYIFNSKGDKTEQEAKPFSETKCSQNPLSPFIYRPDRVRFINEDPEEKIILLLRKHPITNLGWIIISFLTLIAPSFVSVFDPFLVFPGSYRLIIILIWYLILFFFVFEKFLKWFFHVNIITDERIIEVDFVSILYREITDANIDQIQDVTVPIGGGMGTFFNYGDVIIQTASEVPRIVFESVYKPDAVAKILRELRVEEEKEKLEGRVR